MFLLPDRAAVDHVTSKDREKKDVCLMDWHTILCTCNKANVSPGHFSTFVFTIKVHSTKPRPRQTTRQNFNSPLEHTILPLKTSSDNQKLSSQRCRWIPLQHIPSHGCAWMAAAGTSSAYSKPRSQPTPPAPALHTCPWATHQSCAPSTVPPRAVAETVAVQEAVML
jgi:hypothetical protein